MKQFAYTLLTKISKWQETFCGVVDDEFPLSEVIKSDEEMIQRLSSNYVQDDLQECVSLVLQCLM